MEIIPTQSCTLLMVIMELDAYVCSIEPICIRAMFYGRRRYLLELCLGKSIKDDNHNYSFFSIIAYIRFYTVNNPIGNDYDTICIDTLHIKHKLFSNSQ